jgi:hypothetical protein
MTRILFTDVLATSPPVIDLNFAAGIYSGGTLASLLSVSNSTGGYVTNADGTLCLIAPNTPRVGGIGNHTNLNLQSQALSNATWTDNHVTVTTNATTAPDGTTTAEAINTANLGATVYSIFNASPPTIVSGSNYTLTHYVKAGALSNVYLTFSNNPGHFIAAAYNLSGAGSVGQTAVGATSGTIVSTSITALANGWYRLQMTGSILQTAGFWEIGLCASSTGNTFSSTGEISVNVANTPNAVFGWGAQLEAGSVATTYIPTTTVAVTAVLSGPNGTGLLVEESRTNLFLQSGDISNAAWTRTSILSVTGNAAVAPDGTTSAALVIPDNVNFKHRFRQTGSVLNNTFYSTSIFVKAAGYSKFGISAIGITGEYTTFDLQTGTVIAATTGGSIQQLTNGWYRCTMIQQEVFGAGTELFDFYIMDSGYVSGTPDNYLYVGDQTSGMYFWGGQNEVGSFSTSYIPTTTVAVTRAADVASLIGLADTTIRHAGASHFVSMAAMPLTTNRYMLGSDHGSVGMAIPGTGSTGLDVVLYDGTLVLHATPGSGLTPASPLKTAMGWNAAGRSLVSANGTVATDANAQVIDPSVYYVGSDNFVGFVDTYVLRVALWNARLSDARLQALSSGALSP